MTERGFRSQTSGVNYWLDLELTKFVADFPAGPIAPPADEAGSPDHGEIVL
jgi:hypothetical protein